MINTCKECINFIKIYNIIDYNNLYEKLSKLDIKKLLSEIEYISKKNNKSIFQQKTKNKTGNYKGVSFTIRRQKWLASLTFNNKKSFLGFYDSDIEAAYAYNDYVLYINEKYKSNFIINDIKTYIPNPRNIPEEFIKKKIKKQDI